MTVGIFAAPPALAAAATRVVVETDIGSVGDDTVTYAALVVAAALMVACACLIAGCVNLWQRRRDERATAERALVRAERDARRLGDLLGTSPIGCFLWDSRDDLIFARLPRGHDAGTFATFDDLAVQLEPDDAVMLATAVSDLKASGQSFELSLRGAGGAAQFRAHGQSVGIGDGRGHALWLEDESRALRAASELERQLDDQRSRLKHLDGLLNHLPLPIYERDADLDIVWCNEAYARVVDMPREQVVGSDHAEIETAMTRASGHRLAATARETGRMQREIRHFVFEGQRRALDVNEVPGLPDGHLIGFVRDVTDLEERESELRRHIDAHSEVLNNLSTAISIFGPDKRLSFYNQAFADLWQFDDDWLSSLPEHSEILDRLRDQRMLPEVTDFPAYKRDELRNYTDLLQTREDVLYLPDGRVLRHVISPHPFGGLLFLDEDITDALVLERSVNTLTAVQRETIDNLYEAVAVYGGDGRLKLFNPAFARIWQLDEATLAEEPHVSTVVDLARPLFPPHDDWAELKARLISQATSREDFKGRMERPDSSIVDYAVVALPDGNVLFTYLDVSDSVNVERALRDRNQALEAADQLKSEFLASVSYELRTPLNVIIGFAEVLVNQYFGPLNERQLEYGHDILGSSQQLLALINDILDLASIEAGRLELELNTFDVRELLENVVALGREGAQRRRMRLELECVPGVGVVEADEKRIKQAMFNLVNNSLKYTDSGGEIRIGARSRGEDIELYVADNGAGISAEDREIIFEAFRHGRAGANEHSAGLGLSLVKRFAELHNGRIELESEVGKGTRVSMILPRRQSPSEPGYQAAIAGNQVH